MRRRREETESSNEQAAASDMINNEAVKKHAADSSESSDKDTEPLDQDDQDDIIADIVQKISKQQKQMLGIFAWLCRATSALSILLVVIDDFTELATFPANQRVLRYLQAVVSSILQLQTVRLASTSGNIQSTGVHDNGGAGNNNDDDASEAEKTHLAQHSSSVFYVGFMFFVNILLTVASIYRYSSTPDLMSNSSTGAVDLSQSWLLPVGLLAANIVTLAGAVLLKWDRRDSQRQLSELQGVKYHYKSL